MRIIHIPDLHRILQPDEPADPALHLGKLPYGIVIF